MSISGSSFGAKLGVSFGPFLGSVFGRFWGSVLGPVLGVSFGASFGGQFLGPFWDLFSVRIWTNMGAQEIDFLGSGICHFLARRARISARPAFFVGPQQAAICWQWVSHLKHQVQRGKEPLMLNLDETRVGRRPGARLPRDFIGWNLRRRECCRHPGEASSRASGRPPTTIDFILSGFVLMQKWVPKLSPIFYDILGLRGCSWGLYSTGSIREGARGRVED